VTGGILTPNSTRVGLEVVVVGEVGGIVMALYWGGLDLLVYWDDAILWVGACSMLGRPGGLGCLASVVGVVHAMRWAFTFMVGWTMDWLAVSAS
jgi:hypothetical protein